jgi:TolA-binding protein
LKPPASVLRQCWHSQIDRVAATAEHIPARDGTTATIQQDPSVVAEKFGVTKESLAATDEQEAAVRAGEGQPREPVLKPATTPASEPTETPTAPAKAPAAKPLTGGIRTAIEDVSNDVKAKSQSLYQRLDSESGGRWQRHEDQIKNLNDKMDEVNGIDDEAYDRLETKRNNIETSQSQMIEDLKEKKGIDPKIADDAVAHYKQAMSLRDLDRAVKGSTTGDVRVGLKEKVDPQKFVNRVQKLKDSGRLEQALGKDGANTLLKEAYDAVKAKRIRTAAAWTAGALGLVGYKGSAILPLLAAAE